MNRPLLIVESPAKIAKLKKILGDEWTFAATVGHFRDLPQREMGLDPSTLRPQYVITKPDVLARLQGAISRASEIYLATDPDREGEAIAWHVLESCQVTVPAYRVTYNSITEAAVRAALAQRRKVNLPLVQAQEARRVLDRLTGYMVSPALQRGASAGRVQSPAIRLLVEREREIANHSSRQHYEVEAYAKGWFAKWHIRPHLPANAEKPFIWQDRALPDLVAQTAALTVADYQVGLEERSPPAPLITSTLQQAASVQFGLSPDVTMKATQKLHEQGLITYHRTDNPNLSLDGAREILDYLDEMGQPRVRQPRTFPTKANAQEGHEAIRPTSIRLRTLEGIDGLGINEQNVYMLIRARALASQMPNAEFEVTKAILVSANITDGGKPILWAARSEKVVRPGWRALAGDRITETEKPDDDQTEESQIPPMKKGDQFPVVCQVLAKKTRSAKRYTEASLVKRLEDLGIGRPATYAAIIKSIVDRGFATVEKRLMMPQPMAFDVVDNLMQADFRFMDYSYTSEVETELDRIAATISEADAKAGFHECVYGVQAGLIEELTRLSGGRPPAPAIPDPLDGTGAACPKCKKGTMATRLVRAEGPNQGKRFLACTERACDSKVMPASEGWEALPPVPPLPGDGEACPGCNNSTKKTVLIKREGKNHGKRFMACTAECGWRDFPQPEWPPRRQQ